MQKLFLATLLICFGTFLPAQDIKPLPDCKDLKEKIIMIRQSFDQLRKTYGKMQKSKKGYRTVYSSDFLLCGETGILVEDSISKTVNNEKALRCDISLQFSFAKNDYNGNSFAFSEWEQKVLGVLREVFSDWEYDFESEGNAAMTYHSFSEKTKPGSAIKKEVDLDIYELNTGWSFNLIFLVADH